MESPNFDSKVLLWSSFVGGFNLEERLFLQYSLLDTLHRSLDNQL